MNKNWFLSIINFNKDNPCWKKASKKATLKMFTCKHVQQTTAMLIKQQKKNDFF